MTVTIGCRRVLHLGRCVLASHTCCRSRLLRLLVRAVVSFLPDGVTAVATAATIKAHYTGTGGIAQIALLPKQAALSRLSAQTLNESIDSYMSLGKLIKATVKEQI